MAILYCLEVLIMKDSFIEFLSLSTAYDSILCQIIPWPFISCSVKACLVLQSVPQNKYDIYSMHSSRELTRRLSRWIPCGNNKGFVIQKGHSNGKAKQRFNFFYKYFLTYASLFSKYAHHKFWLPNNIKQNKSVVLTLPWTPVSDENEFLLTISI